MNKQPKPKETVKDLAKQLGFDNKTIQLLSAAIIGKTNPKFKV
jgi:hypothetical protein